MTFDTFIYSLLVRLQCKLVFHSTKYERNKILHRIWAKFVSFPYLCVVIQIQHNITINPGRSLIFRDFLVSHMAEKKRQLLYHVFPYPLSKKTHCHKRIPIPGTAACMWPFNKPDQITEQELSYLNDLSWVLQTNITVKSFFQ